MQTRFKANDQTGTEQRPHVWTEEQGSLSSHQNIANIKMSDIPPQRALASNQQFSVYKVEILLVSSQTTVTKKLRNLWIFKVEIERTT